MYGYADILVLYTDIRTVVQLAIQLSIPLLHYDANSSCLCLNIFVSGITFADVGP